MLEGIYTTSFQRFMRFGCSLIRQRRFGAVKMQKFKIMKNYYFFVYLIKMRICENGHVLRILFISVSVKIQYHSLTVGGTYSKANIGLSVLHFHTQLRMQVFQSSLH